MLRSVTWTLAATLFAVTIAASSLADRDLILNVVSPPSAYSDSHIDQKLQRYLSHQASLRVRLVDDNTEPAFPSALYDSDSLLNWGRERGGRYLVLVEVTARRLERRKSFHLPLVFHKYETFGVIEGEFRLLDLNRGKVLAVESFDVEKKGPRIFQATMDDDPNDPDLHLTAPGKIVFFDQLEDRLCRHLADRVKKLIGGR